MKQYTDRRHNWTFDLAAAKCRLLGCFFALLAASYSQPASAQFLRLNIVIPPKTGQSEVRPFEFDQKSTTKTGMQAFDGNGIICISGTENFQILAILSHSDSLRNETRQAIPFLVDLAYRNDGQSKPPGTNAGHRISFPLSDCWRTIEFMKNNPDVINAFIFLHMTADIPHFTTSSYSGKINLIIEYN